MSLRAALNISSEFVDQFRIDGALFSRLMTVATFNTIYVFQRILRRSNSESRTAALRYLTMKLGVSAYMVMIHREGMVMNLDLLSACYLTRDLWIRKTYEGLPGFAPKRGWTVVDVGAHQGTFAVPAAILVGPEGSVIAIEPSSQNYLILGWNRWRNRLNNLLCLTYLVGSSDGKGNLYSSELTSCYSAVKADPTSTVELCDRRSLDMILEDIQAIDLIKIDVEGSLIGTLKGASQVLRRTHRVVAELDGTPEESFEALEIMCSFGFRCEVVSAMLYARRS